MSINVPVAATARQSGALLKLLPALLAVLVVVISAPFALLDGGGSDDNPAVSGKGLPAGALPFLSIYQDAGRAFGVSPFLLMAVHEDETNYSTAALAGVTTGLNFAGCCAGPMQFSIASAASNTAGGAGGTWASYANAFRRARLKRPLDYPGRYTDRTPNVYDSFDAIYAAASYFHDLGARSTLDTRTLHALASYKGTPPASLPYARHDYQRAQHLQQLASAQSTGGTLELGDVGTANPSQLALLRNARVSLPPNAVADLKARRISPRLVALLDFISQRHTIAISVLSLGHDPGSNHEPGRAADIAIVDGEVCNAFVRGRSGKCWALAQELDRLTGCLHLTELIYLLDPGPSPDSFADPDHADHIHVGWDGPLGSTRTYRPHLSPCSALAIS
jgi:hypothetical protein